MLKKGELRATGKGEYLWARSEHANKTKHTITRSRGKNKRWKKKNCIEIDVLRRRVTAETLGMGSAGGVVGEGFGGGGVMRS